jgi:sulfur relay (sulfurtransferase) DsrF/TusC family protein
MPWCESGSRVIAGTTMLGYFASFEEERLAFLRDGCMQELRQRQPADDDERDRILSTRILHEIDAAGRIGSSEEPTLLIDALKAWG